MARFPLALALVPWLVPSAPNGGRDVDPPTASCELVVRLVRSDGSAWTRTVRLAGETPSSWPAEDTLVGVPSAEDALSAPERLAFQRLGDGAFAAAVQAGGVVRVALIGGDRPWRPVEVRAPDDGARAEVVLVAEADGVGLGTLAVTLDQPGEAGALEMCLEDPATSTPLVRSRFLEGTRRELVVPAGLYRLAVQGAAEHELCALERPPLRHGRFETAVRIVPGATSEARVPALPAGGRLSIRLAGDEAAARLAEGAGCIELDLLAPGRWPVPVGCGRDERAERVGPFLWQAEHDVVTCTDALPAGTALLVARRGDGRELRVPVHLVDGALTPVALDFRAAARER